jgi:hypothetical protein
VSTSEWCRYWMGDDDAESDVDADTSDEYSSEEALVD